MSKNEIRLAENCKFNATEYTILKTAILGLPNSGKSYTAMKIAEECLDNKIPITVLDPVGIWHNLKKGKGQNKGYEIIVAGGRYADIPLTIESAPKIMHAAIANNIPVIFDLFSLEMSEKVTWIKVLSAILEVLLYHNDKYGPRHIFIEEAGEFCPQNLKPQHVVVFSWVQRLTTIGRNMKLGVTFINQRAEDISKTILENCNITLLHKQRGKNSIKNIKAWLEGNGIENYEEILQSIPRLGKGECWVLHEHGDTLRIKVEQKKTFHPNPEINSAIEKEQQRPPADVSQFIEVMKLELQKEAAKNNDKGKEQVRLSEDDGMVKTMHEQVNKLTGLIQERDVIIKQKDALIGKLNEGVSEFSRIFSQLEEDVRNCFDKSNHGIESVIMADIGSQTQIVPTAVPVYSDPAVVKNKQKSTTSNNTATGKDRMLMAAARYSPNPITKKRMAAMSFMSYASGTFGNYYRELKREGFIQDGHNRDEFVITKAGLKKVGPVEKVPTNPHALVDMWCKQVLGDESGLSRILKVLVNKYPKELKIQELTKLTGLSNSGTFGNYYRELKRLGLITVKSGVFRAADEIFMK